MNHPERPTADARVDEADNSTDQCLGGDDERWLRDLAWAREALAPFRDIPFTPHQERGLVLWTQDPQPAVSRSHVRRDRASTYDKGH